MTAEMGPGVAVTAAHPVPLWCGVVLVGAAGGAGTPGCYTSTGLPMVTVRAAGNPK